MPSSYTFQTLPQLFCLPKSIIIHSSVNVYYHKLKSGQDSPAKWFKVNFPAGYFRQIHKLPAYFSHSMIQNHQKILLLQSNNFVFEFKIHSKLSKIDQDFNNGDSTTTNRAHFLPPKYNGRFSENPGQTLRQKWQVARLFLRQ